MSKFAMWTIGTALLAFFTGAVAHGCQQSINCERAGNTWHRGACFQKGIIVEP